MGAGELQTALSCKSEQQYSSGFTGFLMIVHKCIAPAESIVLPFHADTGKNICLLALQMRNTVPLSIYLEKVKVSVCDGEHNKS